GASIRSPRPPRLGNGPACRASALDRPRFCPGFCPSPRRHAARHAGAYDLRHPPRAARRRTVRRTTGHGRRRGRRFRRSTETSMRAPAPRLLLLSLAVTLAVTACGRDQAPATDSTAAQPSFVLDEASLPPVNRFQPSDLDDTINACVDFAGYVNAKFLAANPVPADRTNWGA